MKAHKTKLTIGLMLALLLITPIFAAKKNELSDDATRIANQVSLENMRETISRLSALPTRISGYEGSQNAAKYVFDKFQEIGLQDVRSIEFPVTAPIDHDDGKLRLLGPNEENEEVVTELKIYPIWPNLVRTPLIPNGIKHRVKGGETLESIAASYRVPPEAILNDLHNKVLAEQPHDGKDNDVDGETDEANEVALPIDFNLFIPTGGLSGRLLYVGACNLEDFNGKDVGGFWHAAQPDESIENIAHAHRVSVGSIIDDILNAYLDRSNDGIDNNEDGNVDEDGELVTIAELATWANDGRDNDGDGIIDENPGDDKDGLDNNHNGEIDEKGEYVEASEASIFIPQGAIVLADFNSSTRWINATMLGASAVIFIEPDTTIRGEAEAKFLTVPAHIPRFWISKKDADYLLNLLGPDGGIKSNLRVRLTATMNWERRTAQNIIGFLEGADSELKNELVIIQSYFDSMSVVPALSPGAETTSGIAALLETARLLAQPENRPSRSVMFLATSGHFLGLAGTRDFMDGVSKDIPTEMRFLKSSISSDLREFEELGRKIVLAIDRGLLIQLPPAFFQDVRKTSQKLESISLTLDDLTSIRAQVNSFVDAKRDEIEKKKREEEAKKREKESFTPEDQLRLEALLAKAKKDGLQTAHFFKEIADDLTTFKARALKKARESEKEVIENMALKIAELDIEALNKLESEVNSGKVKSYKRDVYIYTPDQVKKLGIKLEDWEMEKFVRLYSHERILDRHLDSSSLDRMKKARETIANAKKSVTEYQADEDKFLKKALEAAKIRVPQNIKDLENFLKSPQNRLLTPSQKELLSNYLGSSEIDRLSVLRKTLEKGEGNREQLQKEDFQILNAALFNANREVARLQYLVEHSGKLSRDYSREEERTLKHYLSEGEYQTALEARKQLFSLIDENRFFEAVKARSKNDILDLRNLLLSLEALNRDFTEDEKRLLRDNMMILTNARIRNIHKKIEIMARIDEKEYEEKIGSIIQNIELQDQLNRYYTSLFVSIDLSTQSPQFGVFGKGWFYDQEPEFVLRREFATIGNKLAEYAENANFGEDIESLWKFSDYEIRQAVLKNQWDISSKIEEVEKIEGKTLETLVSDYYPTLVSLNGVSRLMKLQFEDMRNRGEPSTEMLKDMEYIRKEVVRFIRNTSREYRKDRKNNVRLYRKLDQMLTLRGMKPEDLTDEEGAEVRTLIGIVGAGKPTNFVNAISATGGKTWRTYIPGKIALDSEAATLAGKTGIAFSTIDDARVFVDTPLDTLQRMNFTNLYDQVKSLSAILIQALKDPEMPTAARVGNFYCELSGDVVEFDARESALPKKPVAHPILTIRGKHKTMMGVRGDLFTTGDIKGKFLVSGLGMEWRAVNRPGRVQEVEAYILDDDSGDIVYAPDLGLYGAKIISNKIPINARKKGARIVVFPCVSTTIYDLVDQRYLRTLRELSVYDAATDADPEKFGFSKPWFQESASGGISGSAVEPIAIIYSEPNKRLKIGMSYGLLGKRLLLIKAGKIGVDKPTLYTGEGFMVRENGSIRMTPYVVVRDMWTLDENRNSLYKRYGIASERLDSLHTSAKEFLLAAEKELSKKNYSGALKLARAAWGYESRAYPDVKDTGNDVVKGVMFYLAILLPFAYFMERLLFAFPNVHKQVGATFGIFLVVFFLLSKVHPAFQITVTPIIILLAFIVLALTIIVISIIVQKFEEQLEKIKRETSKVYKADVGRLSASAAAFSLGVSNMRKRKGRTILTCATLVILTFTVISFTSVRTFMHPNRTHLPQLKPPYTGVLIRDQYWRAMEEPVFTGIMNDMAKTEAAYEGKKTQIINAVSPRAWYKSAGLGDQSFVQLTTIDERSGEEKNYTVNMLVGMGFDEPKVTHIDRHLRYGRWFKPGETYVCVLPNGVASYLGLEEKDVGSKKVKIYGADFTVIGVLGIGFKDLIDLDGEELTPVDYQIMQQQRARGVQMGGETLEGELQKYLHLTPDSVAFLPYEVIMNQGGNLQSVAVSMESSEDRSGLTPDKKLDLVMGPLMQRIALDFFVGKGEDTFLYSSIGMTSFSGMSNLFIPILIAALIVLNTMLGAVYERVREISIYSSVGLAPVHVAFLFIAEACVYAIIGAILGYLLGQSVAWALVHWNLLAGLTLNYSSMSTVTATVIVMAVVLGSTIYPAIKASRMAVPDIERKWKLPEPEGDEWHFDLPFTVLGEEALGLNIFLRDYFEAHADESASDFYIDQVTFSRQSLEENKIQYTIGMMVWLAPYDLGVSQTISLVTSPAGGEEEDLYRIFLNVHRESGEIASWKRVNRRFLNLLRKQFLIWRTFNVEVRNEFHERGRREAEIPLEGLQPQPAVGSGGDN